MSKYYELFYLVKIHGGAGNIKTLGILALTFQRVIPIKRKWKTNVKLEKTKTQCRLKS